LTYPSLKSIKTNFNVNLPSVRTEISGNIKKTPGLSSLSSSWHAFAMIDPVKFRSGVGSCSGRTPITELELDNEDEDPAGCNDSGSLDGLYTRLQDELPSSE
jgi:hypothetical protein